MPSLAELAAALRDDLKSKAGSGLATFMPPPKGGAENSPDAPHCALPATGPR